MQVRFHTALTFAAFAAIVMASGCHQDAAPGGQVSTVTAEAPADDASADDLPEGPDHVALARAQDAASRGGWTLANPEALSRVPRARRDLSGLDPAETLDAIARDAALRTQIEAGRVRFVRGAPYASINARAELDLLVLDQRFIDVLQQIATAGDTGLDVAPGLDLERRVSMNFTGVPIRTVLQLAADETGTLITPHADGIRVRPPTPPGAGS